MLWSMSEGRSLPDYAGYFYHWVLALISPYLWSEQQLEVVFIQWLLKSCLFEFLFPQLGLSSGIILHDRSYFSNQFSHQAYFHLFENFLLLGIQFLSRSVSDLCLFPVVKNLFFKIWNSNDLSSFPTFDATWEKISIRAQSTCSINLNTKI
jgi:hypothetical protein